jgi:hypothetical protein
LGAEISSETAGYFQIRFNHTQIPFGEIVGKRNREIMHEGKYLIDMSFQPIEQIFAGRLCEFTPLTQSPFFGGRLNCIPLPDYKQIPISEPLHDRRQLHFKDSDNYT